MIIKPFDPGSDYGMISEWMSAKGFPVPPRPFLPEAGFIVDGAACGFLYEAKTGSLGWLEWVSGNPILSSEERKAALDALVSHIATFAKEKGLLALFSSSKLKAYDSVLERNGFQRSDDLVTHYVRRL